MPTEEPHDELPAIHRREFLGVTGVLLSRHEKPSEQSDQNIVPQADTALSVNTTIRRLAIPPSYLGEGWTLEFDSLVDASLETPHVIVTETAYRTKIILGEGRVEGLQQLQQEGITEFSELCYKRTIDGVTQELYLVDIWRCVSNSVCLALWSHSFAEAESRGYSAFPNLGDAAVESLGGWSQKGKIAFRRFNVVATIVGPTPNATAPRNFAEQFDRRIQTLAEIVTH